MTPDELARDFGAAPAKVASALYDVFKETGEDTAREWRRNAEAHFASHAKRYPSSISAETRVGAHIEVEIGPEDSARNQGFLGRILELGGEHSPAYLDGLRAVAAHARTLDRRSDAAIGHLLP